MQYESTFNAIDNILRNEAGCSTELDYIEVLEQSGFQEDKLEQVRRFLELEDCDMLDVLSYLAYHTTPLQRSLRARILIEDFRKKVSKEQQEFVDFVMKLYVRNGFKELGSDKLGTLIDMKYHTITDAQQKLQMDPKDMRQFFLYMQQELYTGKCLSKKHIANVQPDKIEYHFHGGTQNIILGDKTEIK